MSTQATLADATLLRLALIYHRIAAKKRQRELTHAA